MLLHPLGLGPRLPSTSLGPRKQAHVACCMIKQKHILLISLPFRSVGFLRYHSVNLYVRERDQDGTGSWTDPGFRGGRRTWGGEGCRRHLA